MPQHKARVQFHLTDCPDFRNDKGVGRSANQGRSTEERTAERPRGGRGARGRGGKTQLISPPQANSECHVLMTIFTGAGATRHRAADDRHAKNIAPYVFHT